MENKLKQQENRDRFKTEFVLEKHYRGKENSDKITNKEIFCLCQKLMQACQTFL